MNSESRLARVESAIKSAFPVDEQWMRTHWPKNTWSVLAAVPTLERRRMLVLMIDRGEVPILGDVGGFEWNDLVAIGYARKSVNSDRYGDIHEIDFQYTGPRFVNDHGQFVSTGNWTGDSF